MSELSMKTAQMMEMLPNNEQQLAYELVKRLVLAWDPDFTKETPAEAASYQAAAADKETISLEDAAAALGVRL